MSKSQILTDLIDAFNDYKSNEDWVNPKGTTIGSKVSGIMATQIQNYDPEKAEAIGYIGHGILAAVAEGLSDKLNGGTELPEGGNENHYLRGDISWQTLNWDAIANKPTTFPPESPPGTFNIIDYGADPTGNEDSTVAIQNAINAAQAYGDPEGGTVYVPDGKYKISYTLYLPSRVTIRGDNTKGGLKSQIFAAQGFGYDDPMIKSLHGTYPIYESGLIGLTLNGMGQTNDGAELHLYEGVVENCNFINFYGCGLIIDSDPSYLVLNTTIKNNFFRGSGYDLNNEITFWNAIRIEWYTGDFEISGNYIEHCRDAAILTRGINTRIYNNHTFNTKMAVLSEYMCDLVVIGNYFEHCQNEMIKISNGSGSTSRLTSIITNNIFRDGNISEEATGVIGVYGDNLNELIVKNNIYKIESGLRPEFDFDAIYSWFVYSPASFQLLIDNNSYCESLITEGVTNNPNASGGMETHGNEYHNPNFAEESHNHAAGDIDSGTLSTSRLPTITYGLTDFANQDLRTSADVEFAGLKIGDNYIKSKYINPASGSDVLILLCRAGQGNNEVIGNIYGQRSTGAYGGRNLNIVYSSASSNSNYSAYLDYAAGTYGSEQWELVSCTYNGNEYIAVRYQGTQYWDTHLFFNGYIRTDGSESELFTSIATSEATNVSEINYNSRKLIKSRLDVEGYVYAPRYYVGTTRKDNLWDTAYSERGSQIAGTGLSWSSPNLNIDNPFNPSGTYANLRAQATTKDDVGLGNVDNIKQAPESHNHDAGDIDSGTLSTSRLPTITTSEVNFANQSLNTTSSPDFNDLTLEKATGTILEMDSGGSPHIRYDLGGSTTAGTYRNYAWGSSRTYTMEAMGDIAMVIDYNDNQSDKMFRVMHNGEGTSGNELFRVQEDGIMQGKKLELTQNDAPLKLARGSGNNSIEPYGSEGWVGIGGGSSGLLLQYYNSGQIRMGNGGVTVRINGTPSTQTQVRNIHVSTSSPSGGSDGDVWMRYKS